MPVQQARPPTSTWGLPDQLRGRSLMLARAVWVAVTLGLTVLVTVGFVAAFADPQIVAVTSLTDLFTALGLDFRLMMAIALLAPFVVVVLISGVVFWRRSRDPMALLFTMTLVVLYAYSSRVLLAFGDTSILRHALSMVFAIAMLLIALLLALFPDGRMVPRPVRWLVPATAALFVVFPDAGALLMAVLNRDIEVTGRALVLVGCWPALILIGLAAQTYRYRRVSGPVQRQQTKWVVLPLGLLVAGFVIVLALVSLPSVSDRWVGATLFTVIPLGLLLPVMVANAVLRHRLYDIDRVISRTVTYGLVMTFLGAAYALGVLVLGAAMSGVTGRETSDVAVAGSVLVVAALFRPVRSRVQTVVDRRFNRPHYDARRLADDFASRLRETAITDTIRRDLEATVATALQPAHVSVWLAPEATGVSPRGGESSSALRPRKVIAASPYPLDGSPAPPPASLSEKGKAPGLDKPPSQARFTQQRGTERRTSR